MGWSARAGGPRGGGGHPASLVALVRRARLALAAARGGESLLLGASAASALLAAGASAGLGLARADLWAAATVGAALCAGAWWIEHRAAPADVARALDRRLGQGGALFTAYELELGRAPGPIARLLLGRVLASLEPRAAVRAVLPGPALPLAAPIAAAAVLAFALEAARAGPSPPALGEVARGLVLSLEDARSAVGLQGGALEAAEAALARARALERELESLRAARPAEALEGSEALAQELAALDRELAALWVDQASLGEPDAPAARDAVERLAAARSWLDALRQGLAGELSGPEAPPAGERGAGGADAPGGVTAEPGDGTMSRSTAPGDGGEAPSAPPDDGNGGATPSGPGAVEGGSSAGAWWPAEYDDVVRRWLERSRESGG